MRKAYHIVSPTLITAGVLGLYLATIAQAEEQVPKRSGQGVPFIMSQSRTIDMADTLSKEGSDLLEGEAFVELSQDKIFPAGNARPALVEAPKKLKSSSWVVRSFREVGTFFEGIGNVLYNAVGRNTKTRVALEKPTPVAEVGDAEDVVAEGDTIQMDLHTSFVTMELDKESRSRENKSPVGSVFRAAGRSIKGFVASIGALFAGKKKEDVIIVKKTRVHHNPRSVSQPDLEAVLNQKRVLQNMQRRRSPVPGYTIIQRR